MKKLNHIQLFEEWGFKKNPKNNNTDNDDYGWDNNISPKETIKNDPDIPKNQSSQIKEIINNIDKTGYIKKVINITEEYNTTDDWEHVDIHILLNNDLELKITKDEIIAGSYSISFNKHSYNITSDQFDKIYAAVKKVYGKKIEPKVTR